MKRSYLLLFTLIFALAGCPTKKTLPDPKPPEPKVEEQQKPNAYNWRDVVEILRGTAPLVGPAPWFYEMLA
ncbi:MAG TPA: hypothetical protein VF412_00020 [Bdellovibrio sp.]|uniref:hypothetical protein n=1 Tax=Bdellovibrio sp. TaxID=28201 RepID=UPI002EE76B09